MSLHSEMVCPICAVPLVMSDRQGIEIDYCPKCRGVWLDRGELDKIIERSAPASPATAPQSWSAPPQHGGYPQPYPKRKKSFLEELFD